MNTDTNPPLATPHAPANEAKRHLAARGFGTFARWNKANLAGQRLHTKTGRKSLVAALEFERHHFILPNL